MKKVAILGCENSHANSFIKYVKNNPEFADIEIVGVYSDDMVASEKLASEFGVPVLSDYTDAVGKIDGLIVTARHGDNHYKYAQPYVSSAVPMFIDKPVTISELDAVRFIDELKNASVKVTGGSSLRHDKFVQTLKAEHLGDTDGKTTGGLVRAPLISQNAYGGFFFYAQHLVEIVCEIFGRYPQKVKASVVDDRTTVIFNYGSFEVVGVYAENSNDYYATRLTATSAHGSSLVCTSDNDWFYNEFSEFVDILRGGEQKMPYEDFIAPVFIMNAIVRSLASKKGEDIIYG